MNCMHCMVMLILTLLLSAGASAQTTQPGSAAALTVAVLDFSTRDIDSSELGKVISETVTIMLAGENGITLVDRTSIEKILQEQELSGLLETEQAIKVGKLVGARVIVVGKAFQLGESRYITAKLVGTETALVEGVLVKGNASAPIDELVMSIAQQITERLRTNGSALVANRLEPDPLPALQAALSGKALPTVAVMIDESHISIRPPNAIDPAVEPEIKRMLLECGVTVKDIAPKQLNDWAKKTAAGSPIAWPEGLENVDWVITGEAVSEPATRVGDLHSCTGRVEINVIDRATGHILKADSRVSRAIDLSENLAAHTALQKSGAALGISILEAMRDRAE